MRILHTSIRPGPRLLRACASFGVGVRFDGDGPYSIPGRERGPDAGAEHVVRACTPGSIVLLSGPSGSGKSRLLARARRAAGALGVPVILATADARRGRTLLDCLCGPLDDAIGVLAAAGLADVSVLARTPGELSEGERWRFGLARAMVRARRSPGAMIVCDEWCSTLDRPAARGVCAAAGRWIRRERCAGLLCATAHEDVARWLSADLVVDCAAGRA